jgi:hypothetical protein
MSLLEEFLIAGRQPKLALAASIIVTTRCIKLVLTANSPPLPLPVNRQSNTAWLIFLHLIVEVKCATLAVKVTAPPVTTNVRIKYSHN